MSKHNRVHNVQIPGAVVQQETPAQQTQSTDQEIIQEPVTNQDPVSNPETLDSNVTETADETVVAVQPTEPVAVAKSPAASAIDPTTLTKPVLTNEGWLVPEIPKAK